MNPLKRPPLELILVRSKGEPDREIFWAFFERGEDIGRIDVLVGLGEKVGVDGSELRHALGARLFEGEVIADEERADRLGVHAVPAYVANRRVVTGVRTLEELVRLCEA